MIPHVDKRDKGGEDAYVIAQDASCIVVADGVGGWNRKGIDPALFSNELCRHYKAKYEAMRDNKENLSLKQLLHESLKDTESIGTSTFVAASIDE